MLPFEGGMCKVTEQKTTYYLWAPTSTSSSTKCEFSHLFQRVREKMLTFSSWGAPLPRKWWRRGGCRRWPRRSSPCGRFASLAPPHQVCEWLLLGNITTNTSPDQTERRVIRVVWLFAIVLHKPNSWRGWRRLYFSVFPHIDSWLCGRLRLINQYADILWHSVGREYQYTFTGPE